MQSLCLSVNQEKGNQMMDSVANAAQSAKDTVQSVIILFAQLGLYLAIDSLNCDRIRLHTCNARLMHVQAGQQMMAKAQGAADAVKNATGMNK